jgi:hypothetical protein
MWLAVAAVIFGFPYLFDEVLGVTIDRAWVRSLSEALDAAEALVGVPRLADPEAFGDELVTVALTHIRRLQESDAPAFASTEAAIAWGERVCGTQAIHARAVKAWYATVLAVLLADPSVESDTKPLGPIFADLRRQLEGTPIGQFPLVQSFLAECHDRAQFATWL